jgi:hypothetical protein
MWKIKQTFQSYYTKFKYQSIPNKIQLLSKPTHTSIPFVIQKKNTKTIEYFKNDNHLHTYIHENENINTKKKSIIFIHSIFPSLISYTFLQPFYPLFTSFIQIFLPNNYPHSVTPNYLNYTKWSISASIFGTTSSILSMQCLLYAIGLGATTAIPTAAAINWVLKVIEMIKQTKLNFIIFD